MRFKRNLLSAYLSTCLYYTVSLNNRVDVNIISVKYKRKNKCSCCTRVQRCLYAGTFAANIKSVVNFKYARTQRGVRSVQIHNLDAHITNIHPLDK